MSPLDFLKGQFSRDEAQELADHVVDELERQGATVKLELQQRWAVEESILEAFGFEGDDE